jgi:acyl carrier protein
MDIAATIQRYITDEFLVGKKTRIGPDDSLISSGVLDSLTLLQLISFIEEEFGITVQDEEMARENFQTINDIVSLVERKIPSS